MGPEPVGRQYSGPAPPAARRFTGLANDRRTTGGGPSRLASLPRVDYTLNIVMATSVHIPRVLLDAVDRRARQLKISRNRFILRVLEEELVRTTEWSPGFFEKLGAGAADRAAVEEMLGAIRANRTGKKPVAL